MRPCKAIRTADVERDTRGQENSLTGATVPAVTEESSGGGGLGRVGRNGTDLPSVAAVDAAVRRIVRQHWNGWSPADRDDLGQVVLTKYFQKFGRDRLPDDASGHPSVPIAWLRLVARNAAIDLDRQRQARPFDPFDFQGTSDEGLERVFARLRSPGRLSAVVATKLDMQRVLQPAMQTLAAEHPYDLRLIVWRYVEDRDVDAIAQAIGKSTGATRKAIQRALDKLKQLVNSRTSDTVDVIGTYELLPE